MSFCVLLVSGAAPPPPGPAPPPAIPPAPPAPPAPAPPPAIPPAPPIMPPAPPAPPLVLGAASFGSVLANCAAGFNSRFAVRCELYAEQSLLPGISIAVMYLIGEVA